MGARQKYENSMLTPMNNLSLRHFVSSYHQYGGVVCMGNPNWSFVLD